MNLALRKCWTIPASLLHVDLICAEISARMAECGLEKHSFPILSLAREALNNAVIHGCEQDPACQVGCELELRQDCLLLRVSDEGPGFDWQVLAQQEMAAGDQVHGRGLWLYFRYADRVEFNSCGNRVTFIRCLNHPDPSPAASCQAGS